MFLNYLNVAHCNDSFRYPEWQMLRKMRYKENKKVNYDINIFCARNNISHIDKENEKFLSDQKELDF